MSINFSGMILAAGFGRRMMPLTKDLPKPLLDIKGVTLLENSISFLKDIGCKQIIINTHYQHIKIKKLIDNCKDRDDIILTHENEILDTGGAVKNAISYFKNENLIIINCDIYWQYENIKDAQILKKSFVDNRISQLLLVGKDNAYGLIKDKGDFILNNNKVLRYNKGDKFFFYSGLQILNTNIFKNFLYKKFSFNVVWNYLINKKQLNGKVMKSKWYHVGDIQSLEIIRQLKS